jgi:hypothetical protein
MSLEATLEALRRDLARLQEVVSDLRVTVTEDRPTRGAVVLVDQLDNVVTDLSSALEEADARAVQALQMSEPSGSLDAVRTALRDIHALLNRFTVQYIGELASHDQIARLLEMGRERGREWREWSREVKTAIERCAMPMKATAGASLECWSELAERLARHSVSVQATNIGQQITVREDQLEMTGKVT